MFQDKEIIENIKTTMAAEGCFMSDCDTVVINQFLNHEITEQEGIEKIKNEIISKMEM